nr:hypothetical protein [Tanacetum cinerariifolium]
MQNWKLLKLFEQIHALEEKLLFDSLGLLLTLYICKRKNISDANRAGRPATIRDKDNKGSRQEGEIYVPLLAYQKF